jgi:hypothetical protein
LRRSIAAESHDKPGNLKSLSELQSAVKLARKLLFSVNFYKIQNSYYDMLIHVYPELKASATNDAWVEEFKKLGSMLSVKVE